jgi:peptide/nickel transport system substrate-binding protein
MTVGKKNAMTRTALIRSGRVAGLILWITATTPFTVASETFVFALRGNPPDSLSPFDVYTTNELVIEGEIMEGLVKVDPKDPNGPLKPNIAASVRKIDQTTYVFRLTRDVFFQPFRKHLHDRVTTRDVEFSLRRAMHSQGRLAYRLNNIADVEAVGMDLVKIELKEPDDDFLAVLATSIAHITSEQYFNSLGSDEKTRNDRFRRAPLGTGPYRLRRPLTTGANEILVDRFEGYHDKKWVLSQSSLSSVTYRFYSDPHNILLGIAAKDVAMTTLPVTEFGDGVDVRGTGAFPRVSPPFLPILAINAAKGVLKNARVRQLLNAAIDTRKIGSLCEWVTDDLPAGFRDYMEIPRQYRERDGAKERQRLLADPMTRRRLDALRNTGPLVIVVSSRTDHFVDRLLESVRSDLRSNLGIEVVINRQATISDDVIKKEHADLIYREWTPDTAHEHDDLSMLKPLFSSLSKNNLGRYTDPDIDHLFDRLPGINDRASATQTYKDVQNRLIQGAPLIWLPIVRPSILFLQNGYSAPFTRKSVGASTLLYYTSLLKDIRKR